jgi:hypothetical protein
VANDSDDRTSAPDPSPTPSDSSFGDRGEGSTDKGGSGDGGADKDKSKSTDPARDDEKDANKANANDNKGAVEQSAKSDQANSSEKSEPTLLEAGVTTWALVQNPPNGSIVIGQPPNAEQTPTPVPQGDEAKTFASSGGVLESKSISIGPQSFNPIASAAELKNGVVATSSVEVEGEKIPVVAIYDSDRQQLSVVRDGQLSNGTRIADILRINLRTGDVSAWDAATGITTVWSDSRGSGTTVGRPQSDVPVGGLGLEFRQQSLGGKSPASTASQQPASAPLVLGSVERQQHFGVGSDAEKQPFSSNNRAPLGVEPKARSFRAERSNGGDQGVGKTRPERRDTSPEASNKVPQRVPTRPPSKEKGSPSMAKVPSTHLSRDSQPPVTPSRPSFDPSVLDTFVKGAAGAIGSYAAITETAELIGTYLAYAELAEFVGASTLVATGVLLIPAASAVAAGMGLAVGIAGVGIAISIGLAEGITYLSGGSNGSVNQGSVDKALSYGSPFGLAGGVYGIITDPENADDRAKEWDEMGDLGEKLGLDIKNRDFANKSTDRAE